MSVDEQQLKTAAAMIVDSIETGWAPTHEVDALCRSLGGVPPYQLPNLANNPQGIILYILCLALRAR